MHTGDGSEWASTGMRLLDTAGLCARYGICRATVWRWSRDLAMGFPSPIYIARRPFWPVADLERFEAAMRDPKHSQRRSPASAMD